MNKYAAQITVEQHPAIFLSAALVSEKVQNPRSDLRGEGLVEGAFRRHEIQETLSRLAAGIEALGDVEGVGNGVLLVSQTLALQAVDDLSRRAVLRDDVDGEHLLVSLPQDVPARVGWML